MPRYSVVDASRIENSVSRSKGVGFTCVALPSETTATLTALTSQPNNVLAYGSTAGNRDFYYTLPDDGKFHPLGATPHLVATASANMPQTIAHQTVTAVNFDAGEVTGHLFGYDASNDVIVTPLQAGLMLMCAEVTWAGDATGVRRINLKFNGADTNNLQEIASPSASAFTQHFSFAHGLPRGNDGGLQFTVYQTSGGNLNITAARLSIACVGAGTLGPALNATMAL